MPKRSGLRSVTLKSTRSSRARRDHTEPKKRGRRFGLALRTAMLLALVMAASSSRGDTSVGGADDPAAASSVQPWSSDITYAQGNVVSYNGALYSATGAADNEGQEPDTSPAYWTPLVPNTSPSASELSQISLTLPCIVPDAMNPSAFTAVFGYTSSAAVVVPVSSTGNVNAFVGTPIGRGQPVSFQAGSFPARRLDFSRCTAHEG